MLGTGTDDLRMLQAEKGKIMTGQLTQRGILLHIDCLTEKRSEKREVDTEAPCEVDEQTAGVAVQQSGHNSSLITCRLGRGALLHVKVTRIEDTFDTGTGQMLAARFLPTFNLA